jgi:hypothetical protein
MLGRAVAFAAAITACLAGPEGRAQEREAESGPTAEETSDLTAEQMVEVAREEWRTVEPKGCPVAKPGEILVCKPGDEEFRTESSIDEAIRKGETVPDGLPRAPNVFGLRPCSSYTFCGKVGRTPEPVLMIDLAALPHPLTPEEAARVVRAEDLPQPAAPPATPAAASPAAAP